MHDIEDDNDDFYDSAIDSRLTSSSTNTNSTIQTNKIPVNTNVGDKRNKVHRDKVHVEDVVDPKDYKLGDFNVPVKFAFATDLPEYELIEKGTLKRAVCSNDSNHKYFEIVSKFFETLHFKLPKPGHCKYIRDVQTDLNDETMATFGDGNFATHVKFVLHKLLPIVYCKNHSNTTYCVLYYLFCTLYGMC